MIAQKVVVLEQWRCMIDLRQINSRAPGTQLSDELSIRELSTFYAVYL